MDNNVNKMISNDLTANQNYRRFIYIGTLIGSLFLIFFALVDWLLLKLYIDSIVEAIGSIILFIIHREEAKNRVKPWLIIVAIMTVTLVIMVTIFANNASDGISIWLAIIPFICFLVLEQKLAFIVSIILNAVFVCALSYFCIMYPEKGFNLLTITTSAGALICSTILASVFSLNRTQMIGLLSKQARTDTLTSLLNRRGLMSYFNLFIALYKRNKQDLSILIIDLDHFKQINDNFGHDIGDDVIIHCANILKAELRETDTIARLGGEEYIVLLPNTSLTKAETFAYRIKDTIENLSINSTNNTPIKITASIGVTSASHDKFSFDTLYKAADEALYEAKKKGRNCVVLK